jgi:hypothetical protein
MSLVPLVGFFATEVPAHGPGDLHQPQLLYCALLPLPALAWAVPQEWLLALTIVRRFAAPVVLAFPPIFLANLVVTKLFRDLGLGRGHP